VIGNLLILYQAPALGVQLLIDGILIGAVFALAAYGMALVWGVTNIINVAQGEFVMLGGFVAVFCAEWASAPVRSTDSRRRALRPRLGLVPPCDRAPHWPRHVHFGARHLRHRHRAAAGDGTPVRRR
jgi:ABC-type branched-subunit amino acid transport system permease subunit